MTFTRSRVILLLMTIAVMATATWVAWERRASGIALRKRLEQMPGYTVRSTRSDAYNSAMSTMHNDLARREHWTRAEVERLREYAAVEYSFAGRDWDDSVPIEAINTADIQTTAISLLGERLRCDLPVDTEARRLIIETLVESLGRPHWRTRLLACSVVVQPGLVEDPAIRARVEALVKDPDPDVSANALRQLRHYDRLRAAPPAASRGTKR